jgi:hypothetical protein
VVENRSDRSCSFRNPGFELTFRQTCPNFLSGPDIDTSLHDFAGQLSRDRVATLQGLLGTEQKHRSMQSRYVLLRSIDLLFQGVFQAGSLGCQLCPAPDQNLGRFAGLQQSS